MATINKKISATDYERIGDTQGLLIPQGARFTRFRPPNIAVGGSATVRIAPTASQCAAGGGENWNNGGTSFFVPKAGVYTVTLPDFNTENTIANIVAQVVARNAANTAIETKSAMITTAVSSSVEWQSRDISVYVPEGGRIQAGFYTYQDPGTILFDDTALGGFWLIYLNEVQTPYIVANKGALVSSTTPGEVNIDPDTGIMAVNGDVGTNGASKASINRPDLWTPNVEYNFGGGLYGQRFTGTFSATSGVATDIFTYSVPDSLSIVSYGGNVHYSASGNTPVNYLWASAGQVPGHWTSFFKEDTNRLILRFYWNGTSVSNQPYDVWVTYKK